jgi:peroxiredoxin
LVNAGSPRVVELDSDDATHTFNVDGKPFSKQESLKLTLNTAEEWVVRAKRNAHVFHIHVNPFELILEKGKDGSVTRSEWRDTIFVDAGQEVTFRTRFRDYPGKTVLHCHILDHEDQGMMRLVEILDPKAAVPDAGAKLKEVSAPAPALRLPDTGGTTRDLARLLKRNVVLVFFRGMGCAHCTGQLRALVRTARESAGADAVILAVSGERIEDPARALKSLGVPDGSDFFLLVDEGHRAFQDFGCFDRGPRHGLFLIDRRGMIRSRYVGEAPFDDTKLILERVRRLTATASKPG